MVAAELHKMGGTSGYIMQHSPRLLRFLLLQRTTRSSLFETRSLYRELSIKEHILWHCCKCRAVFVTLAGLSCTPLTNTASVFHAWVPPMLKQHSPGRNVRWYESLLSALVARFLFREQPRPSRPPAFFLPGTWEEKAAGIGFQCPEMSELSPGCKPANLTLSSQRYFSRSLHPPWPASLCGCEWSGLVWGERWCQTRTPQLSASCAARPTWLYGTGRGEV